MCYFFLTVLEFGTTAETTSTNPLGNSSGFGDENQTRSHILNQDKNVILEK